LERDHCHFFLTNHINMFKRISGLSVLFALLFIVNNVGAFGVHRSAVLVGCRRSVVRFMSENESEPTTESAATESATTMDPMELEQMDAESRIAYEKAKRADELRAQEVFMTRSTGTYSCTNCDWVYDETKGDSMMIGGQIQPGTPFSELPSNWRCPVCRASKDSFKEDVLEIPGFEVNQGYGFGGNSLTGEQKTSLIFGGLGLFFLLFLSGYALS